MFRSSKPEPRHQGRAGRGQNNLTPGRLRQQRKGLWGPSCRVELEPGQLSGADWGGGITSQWRLRPSPPPTPTLCQRIRARGGSRHQTNLRTSNTSLLSFHQISPATASTTTTSSGSPRCWCTKSSLEGERVWDDGGGAVRASRADQYCIAPLVVVPPLQVGATLSMAQILALLIHINSGQNLANEITPSKSPELFGWYMMCVNTTTPALGRGTVKEASQEIDKDGSLQRVLGENQFSLLTHLEDFAVGPHMGTICCTLYFPQSWLHTNL